MQSHIHHPLILLVAITGITLFSTPSISSDTHQSISPITVKSAKENSLPQLWEVKINGKYGYIDRTGKLVVKPQFDYGWSFYEGLAQVQVGQKWGYIDYTGKLAIKPEFDDCDVILIFAHSTLPYSYYFNISILDYCSK
jgi:WG containing repeat